MPALPPANKPAHCAIGLHRYRPLSAVGAGWQCNKVAGDPDIRMRARWLLVGALPLMIIWSGHGRLRMRHGMAAVSSCAYACTRTAPFISPRPQPVWRGPGRRPQHPDPEPRLRCVPRSELYLYIDRDVLRLAGPDLRGGAVRAVYAWPLAIDVTPPRCGAQSLRPGHRYANLTTFSTKPTLHQPEVPVCRTTKHISLMANYKAPRHSPGNTGCPLRRGWQCGRN